MFDLGPLIRPAEPIFTTIRVADSLSHKNEHLHFGALENLNVGSFLMLKLVTNSGQIRPLLANLFPLGSCPVALADPSWGSPPGASGVAALPGLPGWIAQSPSRNPDPGLAPGTWILCPAPLTGANEKSGSVCRRNLLISAPCLCALMRTWGPAELAV